MASSNSADTSTPASPAPAESEATPGGGDGGARSRPTRKPKPRQRSKATVSFLQITCPYCRNFYNNATALRCGHTLCHDCLQRLIAGEEVKRVKNSSENKGSLSDPVPTSVDSVKTASSSDDTTATTATPATTTSTNTSTDTFATATSATSSSSSSSSSSSPSCSTIADPVPLLIGEDKVRRYCPDCKAAYTIPELKEYKPCEAFNRIISALVSNLPDHLRKKRAWIRRDEELNPDSFEYVAAVVEKGLVQTKEYLAPLGSKLAHGATEISSQASEALETTRARTSSWISNTAYPWLETVKTNIWRGYESLTTTPDVLLERDAIATDSKQAAPSPDGTDAPSEQGGKEEGSGGESTASLTARLDSEPVHVSSDPAGGDLFSAVPQDSVEVSSGPSATPEPMLDNGLAESDHLSAEAGQAVGHEGEVEEVEDVAPQEVDADDSLSGGADF